MIKTNLSKIIKQKGISLVFAETKPDVIAVMQRNNGKVSITINQNFSEQNSRFLISHCLGHLCLNHFEGDFIHIDTKQNFNYKKAPKIELEANQYASALLMPKKTIDYLILNKKMTSIDKMAFKLSVTPNMLNLRLLDLGIKD